MLIIGKSSAGKYLVRMFVYGIHFIFPTFPNHTCTDLIWCIMMKQCLSIINNMRSAAADKAIKACASDLFCHIAEYSSRIDKCQVSVLSCLLYCLFCTVRKIPFSIIRDQSSVDIKKENLSCLIHVYFLRLLSHKNKNAPRSMNTFRVL